MEAISMHRRDFLTTAIGLIGSGLAIPAVETIMPNRKAWAGCDLSGRVLRKMDLAGADLRHCRMIGTDFTHADLRGARLDHALLQDVRFDGARMAGASLAGAEFRDLIDFAEADLTSADFRHASLSGLMMFEGSRMAGALFAGMRCLPWIESPASTLLCDGADARRIDLSGITANLSCEGADFRGAILVGASLDFRPMELGRPERRERRIESVVSNPMFRGAVFGNTRINGALVG
jgi:uncharacterized protein YjbI with pentapeptide repeats